MCLPVSGSMARVALWGEFRLDAAMVAEAGTFLVHEGVEHHFRDRPYVLRLIAVLPEARLVQGAVKVRQDEAV